MTEQPAFSHPERVRLDALRYAVNDEAATYVAIMRTFTGAISGLLSDQSAAEVTQRLSEQGLDRDVDTIDERLGYLVERGNLAFSPRETEARSLREYLQARARYQLTQRGELVHRYVEDLLTTADTAREVSSEMLGGMLTSLRSLEAYDDAGLTAAQPDEIAREIATLFAQFERLVESTREFYTYLSEVLRRFDLDREEFQAFKSVLIGYLQRFVDEIALHMPQLAETLSAVEPRRDALLAKASEGRRLVGLDGEQARRARGLDASDWGSLHAWFVGEPSRASDAVQVRALATDAMRALLVNLRRIAASGEREASRYRDLVRLAQWFETADDDTAHALWAAAFGLYSCRHIGFAAGDGADPVPPTTSWWRSPVAEVPVTLRKHGDRRVRGFPGRRADFSAAKAHRLAEREAAERRRLAAVAEIARHPGRLGHARFSDEGRAVLLDLYARALTAGGPVSGDDTTSAEADGVIRLVIRRTPGQSTVVQSPQGRLVLCDLSLVIELLAEQDEQDEVATA